MSNHVTGLGRAGLRPRCRFDVVRADDVGLVLAAEALGPRGEYFQAVSRLSSLARRFWFDALILAGMGISIAGAVVGQGRTDGPEGPMWLDIVLAVLITAPLLARRRFPFAAPLGVGAGVVIASFADNSLVPFDFIAFLAGCAAVFLLAQLPDWRRAIAGLAIVYGVEGIVVRNDPRGQLGQFVFINLLFTVVWVVGFTLGRKFAAADEAMERAARAEREREARARAAVAEERARIARELHDVVGHSVSVMTVQASGVRRLLRPEQEREREALLIVERTGREALAEMRRMVGVLRRPEEGPALAPQPSLEHVDRLVEQAREAGLPVDLRVEGEAMELPAGVDLTAYRLVQEGLTNALKHARATRAEVVVNYGDRQIEVMVLDDGTGVGNGDGGGHGLVGIRERVSVYGGELDAGPRPGGGYRLRAKLPLAS
jgi:signal transduction histidine kinase